MSGQATGHCGRKTLSTWAAASLVVMSAVAAVAAAIVIPDRWHDLAASAGHRPAGIPPAISTGTVTLMRLSSAPAGTAPSFTLTDQDDRRLSLAGFRGKAVVLEFMDSRCTDICPLVSQEFIDAYRDLGSAQDRVVFVAVNVNQRYNQVADVLAYSRAHQLTAIPDWHFLTGPAAVLRAVWREYDIAVTADRRAGALAHTATVYFITPAAPSDMPPRRQPTAPAARHTSRQARSADGARASHKSPRPRSGSARVRPRSSARCLVPSSPMHRSGSTDVPGTRAKAKRYQSVPLRGG